MKVLFRAKLLMLSGVVALGGLGALVPMAAHAATCFNTETQNCPPLQTAGGPGQVFISNTGDEFWPGATVRLEVLTPGFAKVLTTQQVTVDPCGRISPSSSNCGPGSVRLNVDDYVGPVIVMADQFVDATHPGLTVPGETTVAGLSTLSAFAQGPARGSPGQPLLCSVSVFGSGFGLPGLTPASPGQNVNVQVVDNLGNQLAAHTTQVDSLGKIVVDASNLSFTYTGPGKVIATPETLGQPVSMDLNLCGSTAMPITGNGGGGGGGGTITGGSGGVSSGGTTGVTRGHAAE